MLIQGKNLVFRKQVTLYPLSSKWGNPFPSYATDGITGNDICTGETGKILHTDPSKKEVWVRVDFGHSKGIQYVYIHDRIIGEPHHTRLAGTDIIVYGQNPLENRRLCNRVTLNDVLSGVEIYKVCGNVLVGSGVELYQGPRNEGHMIHICEIEVYG